MNETDLSHLTEIDAAIEKQVAVIAEAAERATPHGRALRDWTAITRRAHPSQVARIVARISNGDDGINRLIAAGQINEALREVDRITDALRFGGFSEAVREPLQQDIWKGRLDQFGWSPEVGALFDDRGGLVRPGQKISWVDWWTICVDGVDHSHEQIRARARMGGRPIPTRAEVEWQAALDPAIALMLRRIDARKK